MILKFFLRLVDNKKVLIEMFWSFLTKGISLILFLITNVILARMLGVEKFGTWSFFLSIMTSIFFISYFGINGSTRRFVAKYNETDSLKNVLLSSIKLRFFLSSIFTFIFLFTYKYIAFFLNKPELESLFLYGIPLIFLSGFVDFFKSVFMGLYRIKYVFFVNICEFGFKFILVILFLLFSNTLASVISSFTVSLLITSLLGIYLFYFNFYKDLKKDNRQFTKQILNYSLPLIWLNIGFIALTEIDTIMIGIFSTLEEVGIYAVAKQIFLKLPHISLAIVMGAMPIFAKLNNSNKKELKRKLYNILKLNSIIFIVITIIIVFLSPFFIPLIFGEEYIRSVLSLQILSFFLFGFTNSIIFGFFLDYVGRAKLRAINITITIIINIVLNILLIPKYGATGAAIATSVSYLPYVILNWIEVRKILN